LLTTDINPDELLTEVRVRNLPGHSGSAYVKFPNPASGYAVVGVAAVVTLADDGTVTDARVAITGAGDRAVRATAVEDALKGKKLDADTIAAASKLAADAIEDPLDDIHASGAYRAELTRVYTKRALQKAAERAG